MLALILFCYLSLWDNDRKNGWSIKVGRIKGKQGCMIYQKTGEHILTGLAMSTYYLEDIQQKRSEYFCYKGKDLLLIRWTICYNLNNKRICYLYDEELNRNVINFYEVKEKYWGAGHSISNLWYKNLFSISSSQCIWIW